MAQEKPRFDINPHVIRQLGAELVTDQTTALMELIKNSYDADADYVKVTINTRDSYDNTELFYPNHKGYIIVEDSGFGMNQETLIKSWLTISYSNKRPSNGIKPKTPKGRTPLGDKGLGRLSTQRLASICEIFTKEENQKAFHVGFNWDDFDIAERLRDVSVEFKETSWEKTKGTKLVLLNLLDTDYWQGNNLELFKSTLCKLISPYVELRISRSERLINNKIIRPFNVYLTINGEKVDVIQEMNDLSKLCITETNFQYNHGLMNVNFGMQMRKLIGKDYDTYSKIILSDNGRRFLNFFYQENWSKKSHLQLSNDNYWLIAKIEFRLDELIKIAINDLLEIADPGDFFGKIMEFSFDSNKEDTEWWSSLYKEFGAYKTFVQNQLGIKIYRDGFAVRPYGIDSKDWLDMGQSQTSNTSYYGLRPGNVIGYIAIDEADNSELKDKTDREGLIENEYYRNFCRLMIEVVKRVNDEIEILRRAYNAYKTSLSADNTKIKSLQQAFNAISEQADKGADITKSYFLVQDKLKGIQLKVDKVVKSNENSLFTDNNINIKTLQEVSAILSDARNVLDQASLVLKNSNYLREALNIIQPKLENLSTQLSYFTELASLGLLSEMVSHDLNTISGHMLVKGTNLEKKLNKNQEISRNEIYNIVDFIKSTVSSLKSQMKHLDSSMRYNREKKDTFDISKMINDEEISYYDRKLSEDGIRIFCDTKEKFIVTMNKGKLIQVIDNLVNNSIYWLNINRHHINEVPSIKITVEKPWVYVEDNGLGIDPTIENSLFEPFVTRKPLGEGRGLGLFIIRQLLDDMGCDVVLDSIKNQYNRRYRFSINLTSVLNK